jgi:hypothetical protein
MSFLTNQISQPSLDFPPIWIPLISNEVTTHREDQHDLTECLWVSTRFQSRGFSFYSTYVICGRQKWFQNFLQLNLYIVFIDSVCQRGLLHKISTSFSSSVSGLCMIYQKFYCIFSWCLPLKKPELRFLYSCSYTDIGCPVTEVSSF